ncbi:MAG: hypothetical protein IPJ65_43135 [Archangiaceae bacterium]|nr:hypothetical protein [Archangiaceae bacterium]
MTRRRLGLGLVFAVSLAVHLPALANGFTWLDHGDLEQRAALAPPRELPALFTRPYARTGFYRPLTALTLSLDDAFSGKPFGFHLTNLLLHALAAVLVALLAEGLGLSALGALLAGLLFAVHTSTSLVANQLTYRGEALLMSSLALTLLGQVRGRPWWVAAGLLLGCFSKETAFVLAPLLMAGLAPWHRPSRAVVLTAAVSWVGAAVVRQAVAPAWKLAAVPLTADQWVGTRLAALGQQLELLLWPWRGRLCDAVPISSVLSVPAALGLLAVGLSLWLAWKVRPFGLLALLAATPMLNLVPLPRFSSPHYLYVPLAFCAMGLAGWAAAVRWRAWAVGVVLAALAVSSVLDARRYRDDFTLFATEAALGPQCREAHLYLGDALRDRGQLDEAAAAYAVAAAPSERFLSYSDVGAALQNQGVVRYQQGRLDEAWAALSSAYALPADPLSHRQRAVNLAIVALEREQYAEAERLLRPEAERPDGLATALEVLAHAVGAQGRESEAVELLRRSQQGRAPERGL